MPMTLSPTIGFIGGSKEHAFVVNLLCKISEAYPIKLPQIFFLLLVHHNVDPSNGFPYYADFRKF